MGFLTTGDSLIDALLIFVVSVLFFFNYIIKTYSFWNRLGIYNNSNNNNNKKKNPPKFPYGDIEDIVFKEKNILKFLTDEYNKLKYRKKLNYGGYFFFTKPMLLATNLDLIKNILSNKQDFKSINKNLKKSNNKKFKINLNFNRIIDEEENNSTEIKLLMKNDVDEDGNNIITQECLNRFIANLIGIEPSEILSENIENKFLNNLYLAWLYPKLYKILSFLHLIDDDNNHNKNALNKLTQCVQEEIEVRKKNDVRKNDLIQHLLIDNKEDVDLKLIEVAELLMESYEASLNTLSFALHELANNQHIQSKLREEIKLNICNENRKYNGTKNIVLKKKNQNIMLPYLNKIFAETLRKYPVRPFIIKECVKNFKLDRFGFENGNGNKNRNGNLNNKLIILPKGTNVLIPIFAIQRDKQFYANQLNFNQVFNPDNNFSTLEIEDRHSCAYMPFGEPQEKTENVEIREENSETETDSDASTRLIEFIVKSGVIQIINNYVIKPTEKSPEKGQDEEEEEEDELLNPLLATKELELDVDNFIFPSCLRLSEDTKIYIKMERIEKQEAKL